MSTRDARKRARCDSQQEEAGTDGVEGIDAGGDGGRKRDKEFWYEDGNVILVARDVEFRLFKGILADHSPVFKDMFSLPQPPEAATAACPVVHVTDTPEDLRHLLRVYMPKTEPSPFAPENPSFDQISATIRLGHKYQISKLVEHSVNYLKTYYTRDYHAFSKRCPSYWPPSFKAEHAIGVVNLARLTGEHTLLPVAFLICCTLDRDIVKGFQREDGSWEQLTLNDIGICFEAKGRLVGKRAEISDWVFHTPFDDDCKHPARCQKASRTSLDNSAASVWAISDPFNSLLQCSKDLKSSLCSSCWTCVKTRDAVECRQFWAELPGFFRIEENADSDD